MGGTEGLPYAKHALYHWISAQAQVVFFWVFVLWLALPQGVCGPGWSQTRYVAKAGLEPLILLCLPPKCRDYRYMPLCLVSCGWFFLSFPLNGWYPWLWAHSGKWLLRLFFLLWCVDLELVHFFILVCWSTHSLIHLFQQSIKIEKAALYCVSSRGQNGLWATFHVVLTLGNCLSMAPHLHSGWVKNTLN